MFQRTPLAWLNLTYNARRLAVAVGGISFAVVLMFMETGFMYALFDSTVKLIDDVQADIILASPAKYVLPSERRFPLARLHQAQSVQGVKDVYPLYLERSAAMLRPLPGGVPQPVRVIGIDDPDTIFVGADLRERDKQQFHQPHTAIIDRKSKRSMFDFVFDPLHERSVADAELSGKRIQVVGEFELGTDFANDGSLLMSADNLARYFSYRGHGGDPLKQVDIGLVSLQANVSAEDVVARLRNLFGDEMLAMTKQQYRDREVDFWRANTPIGMIFQIGTWMGFVVGVIICYQVLYTEISDHLSEYATLKAMGYTTGYFVRLVLVKALMLSLLGFVPGFAVSWLMYQYLAESTGLLMQLTLMRVTVVYLLTLGMCAVSGALSLRRLLGADPATLF